MNGPNLNRTTKNILLVSAIGLFLGLLAPFGMDSYPLYINISFWVLVCNVGYTIYAPAIAIAITSKKFQQYVKRRWHRIAVGAFIASIFMTFAVHLLTWQYFGYKIDTTDRLLNLFPRILIIGTMISIVGMVREHLETQSQTLAETKDALETVKQTQQEQDDEAVEAFMQQLPVDKRGSLLCLEMSDHYIKVYTDKGHHMVLMRFKDALNALQKFPGFQTHRSWWVAHQAITQVDKADRKLSLVLSNGLSVPVSKTYLKTIKEAGFAA